MAAMVAGAAEWAGVAEAMAGAAAAEKATNSARKCASWRCRQLYETLHMTSGRSNTSLVIRYVYDIPMQSVAQSKQ